MTASAAQGSHHLSGALKDLAGQIRGLFLRWLAPSIPQCSHNCPPSSSAGTTTALRQVFGYFMSPPYPTSSADACKRLRWLFETGGASTSSYFQRHSLARAARASRLLRRVWRQTSKKSLQRSSSSLCCTRPQSQSCTGARSSLITAVTWLPAPQGFRAMRRSTKSAH